MLLISRRAWLARIAGSSAALAAMNPSIGLKAGLDA